MIWIILLLCAVGFVIYLLVKHKPYSVKFGSFYLISGGVKTLKTGTAVFLAVKRYRKSHRKWKFKAFFQKLLRFPVSEEPHLYSSVPLRNVPFVPLTGDILKRQDYRPTFGSVIFMQEASLFADSQAIRDQELNERLTLWNKLIGHETHGGCIIYDTQSVQDCHYSIKRCLSNYMFITELIKIFPFFFIVKCRELTYSEDNSSVMTIDPEENQDSIRVLLVPKRILKYYDPYAYSYLTDNLTPLENVTVLDKNASLKAKSIVTIRKFKTIDVEGVEEND